MSEVVGSFERNYLEAEFYEQLRNGLDAFRFLLDTALDGMWYWDLERPENEWMSPRFWTCLGYDPRKMPHKSSAWQNIIFKEDLHMVQSNFEKHLMDPNHPYDQMVRYRHKTGKTIWMQCKGVAIRNKEGKAVRMLGIHINRTDQKIKEELSKANLLLNESQRLSKTGAWEMDVETGKIFWSDEVYSIHEVDKGCDIYKLDGISFYHRDYQPLIAQAVEDAIEKQISYDLKCQFITAKGRHLWVRATGYPVLSEGKTIRLFGMFSDITRDEEDKWEIERKQKFSRQLIDNMYDGFAIIKKDGTHDYANRGFLKMTGFSEKEILGHSPPFIYWPMEEVDKITEAFEQTLKNNFGIFELVFCRKDGERFPVRVSSNVLRDPEGNILYYYANITDISELNAAIRKLTESEMRYQLALDGTGAGLWDWDMVNDIVYFSPLWKSMLGYKEEEVENTFNGWKNLWHPDDKERIERAVQDYLDGNTPEYLIEHRLKHKDGSWRWILTKGDIIKNDVGKPLRWVGTNIDLTEKIEMEVQLKKTNEKLKASLDFKTLISETIPAIFAVKDNKFRIIDANNRFLQLYPENMRDKVIGYTTFERFSEKDREFLIKADQKAFDVGFSEMEETITFPTGEMKTLFTRKVRFTSEQNEPFILLVAADLTELKRLKELQKEKDDLTKKILEQNNRLKNFAHIVSHNLRSHSKGIGALLGLYQKENPAVFENQIMQLFFKASDNLEQTIQDLTQVVKAQLDDEVVQSINIYASLEKAINLVLPMAREEGFMIINKVDPAINVLGINSYIDSIFLNFLTNAIKYCDSSKEMSFVEITTHKYDQFVRIDFKDNGLGIDLNKYGDKLFGMYQTFHRGKDSRGIGLYITKNQIETMQGEIKVDSHIREGTIFQTFLRISD
ncbi:MAG: PAS domain-containing protein [Cyclobacteriaceae bacterium]|nr:PAS domain-containing protein [Cyclobacteriaceae bacterium]